MVTFAVNNRTLLVHHIIIFQQSFPDPKVIFLHLFLCTFNTVGNHFMLDHLAFFITHPVHQCGNLFTSEHAHEVVFEGNEKFGRTGITLPSCTATELPVHTAAFVSFGSEDCQTACFFHSGPEFNICTTSGHVCGNGNSSRKTGFSYHLCFFSMLLCIQHVVRNTFLFHHPAQQFTYLN